MVESGYQNDNFNAGRFKDFLKKSFDEYNIKTVLDYGSGRGNWHKKFIMTILYQLLTILI